MKWLNTIMKDPDSFSFVTLPSIVNWLYLVISRSYSQSDNVQRKRIPSFLEDLFSWFIITLHVYLRPISSKGKGAAMIG